MALSKSYENEAISYLVTSLKMSKKLQDAYSLSSVEDTINLYKAWSKNYDRDFAYKNNYKSPQNVVKYFLKLLTFSSLSVLSIKPSP